MSKSKYGNFTKVYDFMITGLKLAKLELLVYAYIFALCENGQSYYGSQQYLADRFGTCRMTIYTVLKKLVDNNLIIKEEVAIPQGKGCIYTINYDLIKGYIE